MHFALHILGIDLVGIIPVWFVRLAQDRIEPLARQIGPFELVTVGAGRLGEGVGDLAGQGGSPDMGDDQQRSQGPLRPIYVAQLTLGRGAFPPPAIHPRGQNSH